MNRRAGESGPLLGTGRDTFTVAAGAKQLPAAPGGGAKALLPNTIPCATIAAGEAVVVGASAELPTGIVLYGYCAVAGQVQVVAVNTAPAPAGNVAAGWGLGADLVVTVAEM